MARYPGGSIKSPEWRAIRKRIGERSGWKCETCGAPHMTIVARGSYGGRDAYMIVDAGEVFDAETGLKMATMKLSAFGAYRVLKIVLTVAHLNHDETCNEDGNLAHLCQRHHLRLDAKHHARNAARTRRNRGGQLDLEDML
ncbi:MAG: hypothetical protein M9895_00150 [Aquamicrobium sp.]|uniref:hypothetical protein n=1 Tax=Aquamicrobium sp. TaxID=1872579 RepID=UPI00349EA2E8|nr:hypothetical protein [Aquamicrobium sp.]